MLPHTDLINNINDCTLSKNEAAFWWLGQHSFVLKANEKTIYFDPFLSEHPERLFPPLLNSVELNKSANLILGSHDHIDHIDRDIWRKMAALDNDRIKFVVPELIREELLSDLNIDPVQIIGCQDNRTIEINEIKITGIAAAHEFLDQDERTKQYPYLGYIVEVGGMIFYHSGDTCIYEGMFQKLKKWSFDIVFLPINGRDAVRLRSGCIGNMTYQEAADLSGTLKPKLTIPAHYGMFAKNTIDPMLFYDYMNVKYPELKVCICKPGRNYIYKKRL